MSCLASFSFWDFLDWMAYCGEILRLVKAVLPAARILSDRSFFSFVTNSPLRFGRIICINKGCFLWFSKRRLAVSALSKVGRRRLSLRFFFPYSLPRLRDCRILPLRRSARPTSFSLWRMTSAGSVLVAMEAVTIRRRILTHWRGKAFAFNIVIRLRYALLRASRS